MPLPVGHSLMAYVLHETVPQDHRSSSWRTVLLFVAVANLPDLDFLPGFFTGNPNQYHHHFLSHSLGFALVVGTVLALYLSLRKGRRFFSNFAIFASVCFSHMILDFFTADTSVPYGLPLLWPFSSDYYLSPISIFMSVNKGGSSSEFIGSLFVLHNLWTVLWEVALFVPMIYLGKLLKAKKLDLRLGLRKIS